MKQKDVSEFDRVLDDCLDRVARGETVAQCLALYPEHASRIEPLLRVSQTARTAFAFEPSANGADRARARMDAARSARALEQQSRRRTPSLIERLFARPLPAAAIASMAVIALTAVLLVRPALGPDGTPSIPPSQPHGTIEQPGEEGQTPTEPPSEEQEGGQTDTGTPPITPAAGEEGNFVFYVSDEPNDIGDFESLTITIATIELQPHADGPWVELTPVESTADLVQLQGDRAQELWRGEVPAGDYNTVFIRVESIEGILSSSGEEAEVRLPSDKLYLTSAFSVGGEEVTEFVFDITVHRTGADGRYILSPQASESGTSCPIERVQPQENAKGSPDGIPGKGKNDPPAGEANPQDMDRPGPNQTAPGTASPGAA
jgi:hypothetical protein